MEDRVFQTQGKRSLILRPLTPQQATDLGCPGSTDMLVGRNGHTVGTVKAVTGREVRVPGWPTRKGVLSIFTPAVIEPGQTEPLKGWVGA